MSRTVDNFLETAQKVDLPYLINLSLIDSEEEYVRIQQEQLAKGQREDGKPIFNVKSGSTQYSLGYAKKKGKSSPIDLHDTGAFYGGIFIHVEAADTFVTDSADDKSGKLQENYSPEIFGLNDESNIEFIPIATDNLIKEFETVLK